MTIRSASSRRFSQESSKTEQVAIGQRQKLVYSPRPRMQVGVLVMVVRGIATPRKRRSGTAHRTVPGKLEMGAKLWLRRNFDEADLSLTLSSLISYSLLIIHSQGHERHGKGFCIARFNKVGLHLEMTWPQSASHIVPQLCRRYVSDAACT